MDILLIGCTGQMGKTLTDLCLENKNYNIVAGVALEEANLDYPIYKSIDDVQGKFDVIIDFSSAKSLDSLIEFLNKNHIPTVIATTGHTEEQISSIKNCSKNTPIVYSGNMSVGVNLLLNIVENISSKFKNSDIEIIEKHHNQKIDSPSGTAKMLYNSVNKGRDDTLFENQGRAGNNTKRASNEVGMHSIRGGNIVGEHTVLFAGTDEIIEITHKASSKKIFANGSLTAANFIVNKENGLYTMNEVLGL